MERALGMIYLQLRCWPIDGAPPFRLQRPGRVPLRAEARPRQ